MSRYVRIPHGMQPGEAAAASLARAEQMLRESEERLQGALAAAVPPPPPLVRPAAPDGGGCNVRGVARRFICLLLVVVGVACLSLYFRDTEARTHVESRSLSPRRDRKARDLKALRPHRRVPEASCYAARYSDLHAVFCSNTTCDTAGLEAHYQNHGKAEKRSYGCETDCNVDPARHWAAQPAKCRRTVPPGSPRVTSQPTPWGAAVRGMLGACKAAMPSPCRLRW